MKTTTIKIKTWRCQNCSWHCDYEPTSENHLKFFRTPDGFSVAAPDNTCPACVTGTLCKCENTSSHLSPVIREVDAEKCVTVNILNENEVDGLVMHNGGMKHESIVEEHNESLRKSHEEELHKIEFHEALVAGRSPDFVQAKKLTPFIPPVAIPLPDKEKEAMKQQIRADIIKFKELEHKA